MDTETIFKYVHIVVIAVAFFIIGFVWYRGDATMPGTKGVDLRWVGYMLLLGDLLAEQIYRWTSK